MDPLASISDWYHEDKFKASYQNPLQPVEGKRFMRCKEFESIEPPPVTKLVGRPRKKRIRIANEPNKTSKKLSKRGQKQKYGICKQQGHNRVNSLINAIR